MGLRGQDGNLPQAAAGFTASAEITETARRYKQEFLERMFGVPAADAGGMEEATATPLQAIPAGGPILGVGFGAKETSGASVGDNLAVRVYVRAKVPSSEIPLSQRVPEQVNGLPTDVIAVGDVIATARPTACGVSAGHFRVTAGTLGCLVRKIADPAAGVFLLSNNHVLADSNAASVGDNILEPGLMDGGTDPIARLTDFEPLDFSGVNAMDAAIAALINAADVTPGLSVIGGVAAPPMPASLYQSVRKHGRTTRHTVGVILDLSADIRVAYGTRTAEFEDQLVVSGVNGDFGQRGDSGSLVVDAVTRRAVGLLFAVGSGKTFVNPIAPVLARFGVAIL